MNTSKITPPEGYELTTTGDLVIRDGWVYVEVKPATKTVGLNFWDVVNNVQAGEGELKVAADATHVNTSKITPPEGYELTTTGDLVIRDGWVYVEVKPATKTVGLNFWDVVNNVQAGEGELKVAADATHVNTSKITPPEGYELTTTGDLVIRDGWVYVEVKPAAKPTKTVILNFYDEVNNKQVEEVPKEVAADATEVWTGDITPPEGYWFSVSGNLPIRDGYVYVGVVPAEKPTKTVGLNFWDIVNNKQLPEGAVTVPSDATHVNTSMITPPAGYEFTETGDLKINDGYVYVGVKPIEPPVEMVTFKVNYVDNSTGRSVGDAEYTLPVGSYLETEVSGKIPAGYMLITVRGFKVTPNTTYVEVQVVPSGDAEKADEEVVAEAEVTDEIVAAANSIVVEENKEASHPANGEVKAEESKETAETTVTDNETAEAPASGNTASAADKESSVPENAEGKAEDPKETNEAAETDNQTPNKDSQAKPDDTPKSEKAEEKNFVQTILDKLQGKK